MSSFLQVTSNVDSYTQTQYNNFGWVRGNYILSASQWADFNQKFNKALNGDQSFVKLPNNNGYIIAVTDAHGEKYGIDNVLVFAKGTYQNPRIDKIIAINLDSETDIDDIRSEIYARELSWTQQSGVFESLFGEELVREHTVNSYRTYQEYTRERGAERSRSNSRVYYADNQSEQDRTGDVGKTSHTVAPDTKFRRKSTGEQKKQLANFSRARVYTKTETQAMVEAAVLELGQIDIYLDRSKHICSIRRTI